MIFDSSILFLGNPVHCGL